MKLLEWQAFLTEQRNRHGKVVFSVAELANAARATPHVVNTELGRLAAKGVVTRYAQGRYGLSHGVGPEQLVPAIDRGAYITGFYALFHYNLVTQSPSKITCFTNRRHNRTPNRASPAGRFRFICVRPGIYYKPLEDVIAPAEQALCDFTYLCLRDGIDPRHLVTFRNLDRLNHRRLREILRRYPQNVSANVTEIRSTG